MKLHGDYLYNNLRNTEEETEVLEQGMEDALRQTVAEYGLVVVGYGGEDKSIMDALLDADISEYGIFWCTRNPDNLSGKAEELLDQPDSYVVEIEGFESLMAQFAKTIDDIEPPTREDIINRAEERADRLEGVVEKRKEAATDEEEEYLDKWSMVSDALEAYREGEYRKAIAIYDEILEQDPEDALALYNRGTVKKELEEYEAAIEDYDRAIDLDSKYVEPFINRGVAKKNLGEQEAAIEDYDRAIELDPEFLLALQNRAEAEINVGNFVQARQDANKAKSLSSSSDESAESLLLQLISTILLEEATDDLERVYRNLCEEEFTTTWSFEDLDSWLEDANLESEKENKIKELIDLLREHKEDSS